MRCGVYMRVNALFSAEEVDFDRVNRRWPVSKWFTSTDVVYG
jgi:hypothetical protein